MNLLLVGLIGFIVLFIFMFLNMPIGFAMIVVGFIGMIVVKGLEPAFLTLANVPFDIATNYYFSVMPLFILMGLIGEKTGLTADAFFAANKWVGHIRGGIAVAATAACTIFAAINGSAIATATTIAVIAVPEMRKYKYADELSLGLIACAGNLGSLIPPSTAFIIYAVVTEQSIGKLFMSGILPGILLSVLFILTIFILIKIKPHLATPSPKATWRDRITSSRHFIGVFIIIVLVLGGIYTGLFTSTEAGAVGVFGIVVLGLVYRRLRWPAFGSSLVQTAKVTGMIFILIIGGMLFSKFMVVTDIPSEAAKAIIALGINPYIILGAVIIFYIIMGCITTIMGMVVLVGPVVHFVLVQLGFDPLFVGVITVVTVLMGEVTPPVGPVVFALAGIFPEVPMFTIFRGIWPFFGSMCVCLIILILFPQIATWLPNLMIKGL